MSTTVSANITTLVKATFKNSAALTTTFTGQPAVDFERTFSTSELTKCYFNTYTVTTGGTTIDLTSLTDAYGNALSFSTVKHIVIRNNDTSKDLTVGGGTNGLFSALPVLKGYSSSTSDNGSCVGVTTNITVDGTHKLLVLTASANSITADVLILGS